MKPLPVTHAKRIALNHGADEVIIVLRSFDAEGVVTNSLITYGRNEQHAGLAKLIGESLFKLMGWMVKDGGK